MEKLTIIFSSNDKYAMLLGVALCSIFENKKGNYSVSVYVIDAGISAKNKEWLGVLEKRYGFAISYILPDKKLFDSIPINNLSTRYYLPIEVYYRIAIASLLPADCRKLIYLDVDVIVRGDLAALFNISLDGKTVGAVADCHPKEKMEHLKKMLASIRSPEMPRECIYFNSGALLIDLDLWRKRGIEEKLFRCIQENPDKLWYHDQDALNIVLLGDCKKLPAKYNLLTEHVNKQNERNPLVVHFVGGGKPWYILSALPYQPEYVYYVNKTPWKNRKYRKLMDVYFAKKYHLYPIVWRAWIAYKKLRTFLKK